MSIWAEVASRKELLPEHVAAHSAFWRLAIFVASPIGSAFFMFWDGVAARKALLLHQERNEGLARRERKITTTYDDETVATVLHL